MRKTIAAASLVAGIGVVGVGGTAVAAADDSDGEDRGGWVEDALGGLVDDGTITQDQADAVEDALSEARPDHGVRHGGFPLHDAMSTVAETLGIDEEALRSQLDDGTTIADLAEEQGVDVQDVVDDLVAAHQERLDEAVADGDLTQDEADEMRSDAEERITAFVNGERPERPDPPDGDGGPGHGRDHRGPGGGGPWGHGWGDGPDEPEGPDGPDAGASEGGS